MVLWSGTVLSPFVYEEPISADELIGRASERETLTGRALDARNSRLEGPRRYGKTSLLRAALADCERFTTATVEVNFLGCVTAADVSDRIERAYGRALQGPLRRWYDGLVRTWRPNLQAAPGGVGLTVSPQPSAGDLTQRLALPRRLHERTGQVTVVAFDEFQEVMRVDDALPGVFRAEMETHGPAAAYIFSGSHPGLMRDMFSDRRHAFFAQAAPVRLEALAHDDLAEAIGGRFEQHGRDAGEALGPLLDTAAGHPQRAMLLAHHLFMATPAGATADLDLWEQARIGAARETHEELAVLWSSSTSLERRVLKAVADGTVGLTSGQARARFGLPKSGSVATAAERLAADGHLLDDDRAVAGWRLVDPFLGAWLRDMG